MIQYRVNQKYPIEITSFKYQGEKIKEISIHFSLVVTDEKQGKDIPFFEVNGKNSVTLKDYLNIYASEKGLNIEQNEDQFLRDNLTGRHVGYNITKYTVVSNQVYVVSEEELTQLIKNNLSSFPQKTNVNISDWAHKVFAESDGVCASV